MLSNNELLLFDIKLFGIRVFKVYILFCVILGIYENSLRDMGIQEFKIYLMMKLIVLDCYCMQESVFCEGIISLDV